MEERLSLLEGRLGNLEKLEIEIAEKEKQLAEREKKCETLLKKLALAENSNDLELKDIPTPNKPAIININVCGKKFAATQATLLKYQGCYFHYHHLSPNEELFIERDPKLFRHVLNFIVSGILTPPDNIREQTALEQEFKYYNIPFPLLIVFPIAGHAGDLVGSFANVIKSWFPSQMLRLLFKATIHGNTITDLCKMVANRGPTLVIVRSTSGFVFGGFTPLPLPYTNLLFTHPEMFIFTLYNPFGIPPTRYFLKMGEKCGMQLSLGGIMPKVTFGEKDLVIPSQFLSNESSVEFPFSYADSTGRGRDTFTGTKFFTVAELEVYLVMR